VQWYVYRDDVAIKVKPTIGTPEFKLTVIWWIKGSHLVVLMTSRNRSNSEYFMKHIMVRLIQKIFERGRNWFALPLHGHLNNCQVHFSKVAEQFFAANDIMRSHILLPARIEHQRISGSSGLSKLRSSTRIR
jgi:hypothetical protein